MRGLWPDPWQDNATFDTQSIASDGETVTFHIQDQYNVPTVFEINTKWNAVAALLGQADADASEAWYINFASGSSAGAYRILLQRRSTRSCTAIWAAHRSPFAWAN